MELARLLGWPVVLVLKAGKSGRSLAFALRGFTEEAGAGRIAGVILNGVSGNSHAAYLREAIAPLAVPVLGALPFCPELVWEERHLGLRASQERDLFPGKHWPHSQNDILTSARSWSLRISRVYVVF